MSLKRTDDCLMHFLFRNRNKCLIHTLYLGSAVDLDAALAAQLAHDEQRQAISLNEHHNLPPPSKFGLCHLSFYHELHLSFYHELQ